MKNTLYSKNQVLFYLIGTLIATILFAVGIVTVLQYKITTYYFAALIIFLIISSSLSLLNLYKIKKLNGLSAIILFIVYIGIGFILFVNMESTIKLALIILFGLISLIFAYYGLYVLREQLIPDLIRLRYKQKR